MLINVRVFNDCGIGVDDSGIVGIALVKVDIATRHMPQKGFSISLENGDDQVDGSELQERAYFFRPRWWVDTCPVTNKPIIPL